MTVNPYAPPSANVDDVTASDIAPPLWNPNAAANWCLLFSPAFGAFLHMKNWQALGEARKAASAKVWAILSVVGILAVSTSPLFSPAVQARLGGLSRLAMLVLLISWYFGSARGQAKYVQARFGDAYPRRGWGKPFLYMLLAFVGLAVIGFVVGVVGALLEH